MLSRRLRSDTVTPSGRSSARATRARRSAAKAGSGSVAAAAKRSPSNGSDIALSLPGVGAAEGDPGPDEQSLSGVHGALQQSGHFGHRQVVQVAQGQGGPMVRGQTLQNVACPQGVQP